MSNATAAGAMEPIELRPARIEWKQLWSLTALYASVIIGWIAYYRYQPKLLNEFSFSHFSFFLTVAQAIILVVTPPIAGRFGDRYRFKKGHRIPIISGGMSFAAMIFMSVAFTLISNPGDVFRWVLPFLIVFWLIAMSIFTSPALSTMELFTPVDKLPRAMALLTIVANLLYALEPVIVDIIDFLGAPITFITGGVVVFVSGYALKKNSMGLFSRQEADKTRPMASFKLDTTKSRYGFIFLLGLSLGAATTVLFNIFPDVLEKKFGLLFPDISGNVMIAAILVVSAVASLPITNMVEKAGLTKSFWRSIAFTAVIVVLVLLVPTPEIVVFLLVLFAIGFTALSVSSLPLAIGSSNYYEKVFCVGIFFSAVAVPDGIVESVLAYLAQ
jgi:MFS family permease